MELSIIEEQEKHLVAIMEELEWFSNFPNPDCTVLSVLIRLLPEYGYGKHARPIVERMVEMGLKENPKFPRTWEPLDQEIEQLPWIDFYTRDRFRRATKEVVAEILASIPTTEIDI